VSIDGKDIPVAYLVKLLGNREIACHWISERILFNVSIIWSGESYSSWFVLFWWAYLSCYGDGFVEVDLGSVYVGGYVGSITGVGWLNVLHA